MVEQNFQKFAWFFLVLIFGLVGFLLFSLKINPISELGNVLGESNQNTNFANGDGIDENIPVPNLNGRVNISNSSNQIPSGDLGRQSRLEELERLSGEINSLEELDEFTSQL